MKRVRKLGGIAVVAAALSGCSSDSVESQSQAAQPFWAQPDTLFVPVAAPSDAKSISRESMWVTDPQAGAVFIFAPGEDRYVSVGAGDREPSQILVPAKLAISPELGVSVYDGETQSVDLYTMGGEFIRGFGIEFTPSVMEFTSAPIGYIFAIVSSEYEGQPRVVIIQTDAMGGARDTLLSPDVGPEELRTALAAQGETLIAASDQGLWVWSKGSPEFVYEVAARSARVIPVRAEVSGAVGLMSDPTRDMLWFAHVDEEGSTYSAYTTQADAEITFLGTRTAPGGFSPRLVFDGILMGWTRGQRTGVAAAFDLNADELGQ